MITVFGSIVMDLVTRVAHLPTPGETVLGESYMSVPGGKGANQALAARRDGADVRLVGAVGTDPFAAPVLATLIADGVDVDGVIRAGDSTAVGFVAVDPSGQNQIFVAAGANRAVRARHLADDWLTPDTTLVMQLEVPFDENWRVIERARAADAQVILNAAPAGRVPQTALEALDIIVMNETEACAVAGYLNLAHGAPEAAGRAIATSSGVTTIVTLGAAGAVAFSQEVCWRVAALDVAVHDTTAAGDAFVGVLAAALDRSAPLPVALHRAAVAGSLACRVAGAQPSLPNAAEIDRHLPRLAPPVRL